MDQSRTLVEIAESAWVHDSALIFGKVSIGERCSLWPHVVIRSELHHVEIGDGTNIQDFAMIHVGYETPTIIGRMCSITHHATVHGAKLGDNVLIGINATVMDGAEIGANSIVAGHSIVTEGSRFPENAVVAGVPAKQVATRDNSAANLANADFYINNSRHYAIGVHRMAEWKAS